MSPEPDQAREDYLRDLERDLRTVVPRVLWPLVRLFCWAGGRGA